MTRNGTGAYDTETELPPLVRTALDGARRAGFGYSCLPAQGRLLMLLAAGAGERAAVIGETGTGCGVGLAWLASGAGPAARLVSIEQDSTRAQAAAEVFSGDARVRVRTGGSAELVDDGPFDLLVLDGGPGSGKSGEPPLDPAAWLRPGGTLVIDDFTPMDAWPPLLDGVPDTARLHWLEHRLLRTTELRLAPGAATLVATYVGFPAPG